jgi:ATP-dependent Clp protease adaptor protein ClpS
MSEPHRSQRKADATPPKAETRSGTKTWTEQQTRLLPQYKVLLHNDEVNEASYVVRSLIEITHLAKIEAQKRTIEAHHLGIALVLVTHKERAELYVEQLLSRGLTVTMEPAA